LLQPLPQFVHGLSGALSYHMLCIVSDQLQCALREPLATRIQAAHTLIQRGGCRLDPLHGVRVA